METGTIKPRGYAKSRYRRPRPERNPLRLEASAALVAPPFTWPLMSTQVPPPGPVFTVRDAPITLTLGNPPIQIDLRDFVDGTIRFVTDHPMLFLTIAGAILWAWNDDAADHPRA
jgi:hypothetical protein